PKPTTRQLGQATQGTENVAASGSGAIYSWSIRQDVGLTHLLPLALEVLRDDPLAEGDMYEGDLLAAALTRSPEVWSESPELGRELHLIVSALSDLTPSLRREVERFLAL
ncbi:contact-dependent growth inhibition system immunity protein, partial [Kitasatospora sp. NPDC096128]|uniref:contact-dependent growth inhibition system immunity protein n=1 Tax=Kitasatospora sp. NPDC096128 TaxID=3155547 RepID=UPI00331E8683